MAEQEEEGGGSSFPNSNSNDDNDQEQNDGGAPKGSLEDELVKQYCIEHFSSKDYIMEPRVIDTLMTYFTAGGQPEMVVKCLSENYQGLESYANLLGRWLSDLGGDSSMISAAAAGERKMSPYVQSLFEQTMSNLVKKVFNPDSVDKIFEGDDDNMIIEWLPELISYKPWRNLIYELADRFPNCLMLSLAVKSISNAGFQHEINNVNTAVQQLDIFSRVFISSFQQLLLSYMKAGENTEVYQKAFDSLAKIACHSEQTFVYSQAILRQAGKQTTKKMCAACECVAQSLRATFEKRAESSSIAPLNVAMIQAGEAEPISVNTFQAILTIMEKKATNPADITQLFVAYSEANAPPAELIQEPVFVNMLIDDLFNASAPMRVNEDHKPKYAFLLAYAATICESLKNGKRVQSVQSRMELEQTKVQMNRICQILFSGDELSLFLNELLDLIKTPIVATCVLHHVKTLITKERDYISEPLPLHFALIDQIAALHSNLHGRVFTVICELYDHQSSLSELAELIIQRQRHILDRFVHLFYRGYVQPVLEKIKLMYSSGLMDSSLIRYFGIEALEVIEPPYSKDLVHWLMPIIGDQEVFDSKTRDKHPSLKEFLNIAKGL